MIIAISGTPGTGKTSVAKVLAGITDWELIGLNELARKKKLYSGYDRKRRCDIVDTASLKREVGKMAGSGRDFIIESHYSHDMGADMVIVLRASPAEIRKRGMNKGWRPQKTEENVSAEIMEVCRTESIEGGTRTMDFDTTGRTPEESAAEIVKMLEGEGLILNRDVRIPAMLRDELRQPYGKLFPCIEEASARMKGCDIISVGDFVSHSIRSLGIRPRISVVDGMVRRKPFGKRIKNGSEVLRARNPPGSMTRELWTAARKALDSRKPVVIEVDGEEDMAVLPFLLMAREGMCVAYGLFDRGVCVIRVDETAREMARGLMRKILDFR